VQLQKGYRSLEDKLSTETDLMHFLEQARYVPSMLALLELTMYAVLCSICTQIARELNLEPLMTFEPTIMTRKTAAGFHVRF